MKELTTKQKVEKYDEILIKIKELRDWAENGGDLQDWEEGDKFFDYDWNKDKSDGYMFVLFHVFGKLSHILGEKTFLDEPAKSLN